MEAELVSEKLCSFFCLECQTMEKVKKPDDPQSNHSLWWVEAIQEKNGA
jgi:hypothetical protein